MKICIRYLSKEYETREGRRLAIQGINLDVADGEFVSIVGPNGCGKTTLLNIVAGLEQPTRGTVEFIGARTKEHFVSMVWQDFRLFNWRTVDRNVDIPGEFQGENPPVYQRLTRRFLNMLGVQGYSGFHPHQLSAGTKQKVAVARALANEPELLLMDEPLANLDPQVRLRLQEELVELWEKGRKTILYVTHNLDEAIFLSDRIVVMGGHPGTIQQVVPVTLPRPRSLNQRGNPAYGELFQRLWDLLKSEVTI